MSFDIRMYQQTLPDVNDFVVTRISKILDAYIELILLEYNNINAIIIPSEISRRRIKSVRSHLKPGQQYVMQVIEVDTEKGYISVSKKYVNKEDEEYCMDKYNKSKIVHSITKYISTKSTMSLPEIMENLVWPLYNNDNYDHALDGFKDFRENPSLLKNYNLPEDTITVLNIEINRRLKKKPIIIYCEIELNCFNETGVDAILAALISGYDIGKYLLENNANQGQLQSETNAEPQINTGTEPHANIETEPHANTETESQPENKVVEDDKLKIVLIKTPIYSINIKNIEENLGNKIMTAILEKIQKELTDIGGIFTIHQDITIKQK